MQISTSDLLARGLFARGVSVAIILSALAGCQKGPDVVEVTGTITRNGEPLRGFLVTFQPERGRPSVGRTDENGYFELNYTLKRKGALKTKHKVFVQYAPTDLMAMQAADAGRLPPDVREILAKYGSETVTPIEVDITGSESFDFQLD
jgi:hypothetical protein